MWGGRLNNMIHALGIALIVYAITTLVVAGSVYGVFRDNGNKVSWLKVIGAISILTIPLAIGVFLNSIN